MEDSPVSDLVFVCETTEVQVGDFIEVKVFINNISLEEGIIACDLPLFYDSNVLELSHQEAIIPASWGSNYSFLFSPKGDDAYCWLRVVPDVPLNEELDFYKYTVTEDNTLGFLLVFTAKDTGKTSLEIKHKADENAYMMMVTPELENFPPNGAKLDIVINNQTAEGSDTVESDTEIESTEPMESTPVSENSEPMESAPDAGSTDVEESVAPVSTGDDSAAVKDASFSDRGAFPVVLIICIIGAVLVIGGVGAFFAMREK